MRRWIIGIAVLVAVLSGGAAYAFAGVGRDPQGRAPAEQAEETSPAAETPSTPPEPVVASSSSTATPGAASPSGARTSAAPAAGVCPVGDKQKDVEAALAAIGAYGQVTVDGVQSPADCAAIIKFQKRFGISPANGRAGPTTADVGRRIAASLTDAEKAKCTAGSTTLTACVDLTQQTVWVIRADGSVAFGPTVVRTGFRGYATYTGTYKINEKNPKEWSIPYKVWLPYWQHFTHGQGFHQTTTYLHNMGNGSHGCVNLLAGDAKELYGLLAYNTTVQVFGRRSGT